MSVKKEPSGRRSVQVEVEVPGNPEQVWKAIATGPGVTAWFVPTTFVGEETGTPTEAVSNFGPGMEMHAPITEWEPPRRFAAESAWGPEMNVATEWIVEAKEGGTCIVRVVHSLFSDTDDWDTQLEGTESGWPGFFKVLRLYLEHFPGRSSSTLQALTMSSESVEESWSALSERLGLNSNQARGAEDAPPLAGTVQPADEPTQRWIVLDEPGDGIAHFTVFDMGGQTCVSMRLYLYDSNASTIVERDQSRWQEWLDGLLTPAT